RSRSLRDALPIYRPEALLAPAEAQLGPLRRREPEAVAEAAVVRVGVRQHAIPVFQPRQRVRVPAAVVVENDRVVTDRVAGDVVPTRLATVLRDDRDAIGVPGDHVVVDLGGAGVLNQDAGAEAPGVEAASVVVDHVAVDLAAEGQLVDNPSASVVVHTVVADLDVVAVDVDPNAGAVVVGRLVVLDHHVVDASVVAGDLHAARFPARVQVLGVVLDRAVAAHRGAADARDADADGTRARDIVVLDQVARTLLDVDRRVAGIAERVVADRPVVVAVVRQAAVILRLVRVDEREALDRHVRRAADDPAVAVLAVDDCAGLTDQRDRLGDVDLLAVGAGRHAHGRVRRGGIDHGLDAAGRRLRGVRRRLGRGRRGRRLGLRSRRRRRFRFRGRRRGRLGFGVLRRARFRLRLARLGAAQQLEAAELAVV